MPTQIYKKQILDTAKYALNTAGNEIIIIRFIFSNDTLQKVKTLPGRKFNAEKKYWTCPLSIESCEKLKSWEFILDDTLHLFLQQSKIKIDDLPEINIPGLRKELYPFQSIGVSFLEKLNGCGLIADEMGLGKTVQAIAYLQLHPELRPVIIVCPSCVKLNWARMCHVWMSESKVQILSSQTSYALTGNILIINYDIVSYWLERIENINPKLLILDEGHYIKNSDTKRTKAIIKLRKTVKKVIGLTGTPIENRPIEIYNLVKIINPTVFPDKMSFAMKYCNAKYNGFGWDFNGASNTQELNNVLKTSIMIRRLKKEVLKDLPDKTRSFIPIEINNRKEYEIAENSFIEYIRENKGEIAAEKAAAAEILTQIETLKQITINGKLPLIIEWIEDFIESDEKLVVFGIHKNTIDILYTYFKNNAVKIDGSTNIQNRQKAVDLFQTDAAVKIFIGNIDAAGVGITLTAASNVMITEIPWVPGKLEQAIDRVHRIGQKESVTAYFPFAVNTIEEKLIDIIDEKTKVISSVLDGVTIQEVSLLKSLIHKYI